MPEMEEENDRIMSDWDWVDDRHAFNGGFEVTNRYEVK